MDSERRENPSLFLVVALATLALLLLFTALHAYLRLGGAPAVGSRWIKEMMLLKGRAADSLTGNRLLVVGGSSAMFGVLAQTLGEETGLPAANLALHNNISPDYLFDWTKRHVRRGDTLLLALEYNYYAYQGIPDMQTVDFVLSLDGGYFRKLPWPERLVYSGALAMDRLKGVMTSPLRRAARDPFEVNPIPRGQTAYQPYSFNRLGDQTWDQIPLHTRHLAHFFAPDFSRARLPSRGTEAIVELARWSRENGVRLIAAYPPFMRFALHDQPRQRRYFDAIDAFYKELGIPLVGSPDDFRYPPESFFDTDYHLHLPAARDHSRKLGRLLKARLDQGT